ncbi:hypothetical protein [Microbacterium sp. W4I20]|uniref:hypothetical protein n=1 Tax=Microbacterium sp. W4I20 TaxID=3042262 RepID=UPI0027897F12|nr:hypothetical protein [Microbacterium sp. W4I20]MDQ0728571.1 hypothetical protein [Microbacterium sp. W4I20]
MTPVPTPPQTPAPNSFLTAVSQWPVWGIPAVLVGTLLTILLLVFVITPFLLRRRMMRKATLDDAKKYRLTKELLTYVKEQSPSRGNPVGLGRFWRGQKMSAPNKFVVLDSLFEKKILHPAYSGDPASNFFQVLWWSVLARPPVYVKLSDRDWNQLANGQPINIAIETLIGKQKIAKQKNIDVRVGDTSQSAVAIGDHAKSKNRTSRIETLTPDQLSLLITALRSDVRSMPQDHTDAEEAESAAEALEADLNAGRLSSAARKANVLFDFISKGTGAWSATMTVLRGLGIGG